MVGMGVVVVMTERDTELTLKHVYRETVFGSLHRHGEDTCKCSVAILVHIIQKIFGSCTCLKPLVVQLPAVYCHLPISSDFLHSTFHLFFI